MKIKGIGKCLGWQKITHDWRTGPGSAKIDFSVVDDTNTSVDFSVTGPACLTWLQRSLPGNWTLDETGRDVRINFEVSPDFSSLVVERERLLKRLAEITAAIGM
jgi:hypothetical protein